MPIAKHRTSFALDEATIEKMKKLAGHWGVSQAEVVRRAVGIAAEQTAGETEGLLEKIYLYQRAGRVSRDQADAYIEELAESRAEWRQ